MWTLKLEEILQLWFLIVLLMSWEDLRIFILKLGFIVKLFLWLDCKNMTIRIAEKVKVNSHQHAHFHDS
jgi:hypothetical protein